MALKAATASTLVAMLLIPLSSVTAHADANPNNRGHHYGQLKHHRHGPPPPAPAPTPGVTHGLSGTFLASGTAADANKDLALIPAALVWTFKFGAVGIEQPSPAQDAGWWPAMAVAASLALLWLAVATMLVREMARRRRRWVPAARTA